MVARLILVGMVLASAHLHASQPGVLRISVTVTSASGEATPVSRHRLQISDNPASAVPRRVITSADGLAEVRLAPGNYTIESEQPVAIDGKGYQWTQIIDIVAGREHILTLTRDNATQVDAAEVPVPSTPVSSSPSTEWEKGAVTIWTATTRGSGVLMDARGLVVVDLDVVGTATTVEVQLSPTLKVTGAVVVSDATRGLALVRISPEIATTLSPAPPECAPSSTSADAVCGLLASGVAALATAPAPAATLLPVEPPAPATAPDRDPARATSTKRPHRLSSSDFDITFITPGQVRERDSWPAADPRMPTGFANWSEYVETTPPVLLIRVTPKLTEGFWTKVARGALTLQGVSIPPLTRLKPDFASMRVVCGTTDVVPIHPFRMEHPLTVEDTLVEGLYVFAPDALGPSCGTVTLHLSSEKQSGAADRVVVDAKIVAQVWEDLAPYRGNRSPTPDFW